MISQRATGVKPWWRKGVTAKRPSCCVRYALMITTLQKAACDFYRDWGRLDFHSGILPIECFCSPLEDFVSMIKIFW